MDGVSRFPHRAFGYMELIPASAGGAPVPKSNVNTSSGEGVAAHYCHFGHWDEVAFRGWNGMRAIPGEDSL